MTFAVQKLLFEFKVVARLHEWPLIYSLVVVRHRFSFKTFTLVASLFGSKPYWESTRRWGGEFSPWITDRMERRGSRFFNRDYWSYALVRIYLYIYFFCFSKKYFDRVWGRELGDGLGASYFLWGHAERFRAKTIHTRTSH